MPYKDPQVRKEKQKEYSRKYYEKNKEKAIAANQVVRARGKEKWDLYKGSLKCARCPEKHIATLDFHHINPTEKEYNVSKLVANRMYTKAYKEIKKCIVLCANCHRKLHYNEKL
jgi:predicted HNH restriction endonuclease